MKNTFVSLFLVLAYLQCSFGSHAATTFIIDGQSYVSSMTLLTYQEAREFCVGHGGDLAHQAIRSMINRKLVVAGLNLKNEPYWIGLRSEDNGKEWKWLSGDCADRRDIHWMPHSPATTEHQCAYIIHDHEANLKTDNWWACKQKAAYALCETKLGEPSDSEDTYTKTIIIDEMSLINSASKTCETINDIIKPALHRAPYYCKKITTCRTNSLGPYAGAYENDLCACECITDHPKNNGTKHVSIQWFLEDSLYMTCTGECDHRGLVRTDYHGCDEVRDCHFAEHDHLRFPYQCDKCACECVSYDSQDQLDQSAVTADKTINNFASTTLHNPSSTAKRPDEDIKFQQTETLTDDPKRYVFIKSLANQDRAMSSQQENEHNFVVVPFDGKDEKQKFEVHELDGSNKGQIYHVSSGLVAAIKDANISENANVIGLGPKGSIEETWWYHNGNIISALNIMVMADKGGYVVMEPITSDISQKWIFVPA